LGYRGSVLRRARRPEKSGDEFSADGEDVHSSVLRRGRIREDSTLFLVVRKKVSFWELTGKG